MWLGDHDSYRLHLSDKRRINVSQPCRGFARESECLFPWVMMSLNGWTVNEIQKSTTIAYAQFQRTDNWLCLIVCVTLASLGILSTLAYFIKQLTARMDLINRKHVQLSSLGFYRIMHLHVLLLMVCWVVVAVVINGESLSGSSRSSLTKACYHSSSCKNTNHWNIKTIAVQN